MTLSRRKFLRTLGIGVLAAATPPLMSLADWPKRPRPNIIFIMADDHAPHGLSCYGSSILSTPNIDRLAQQGMRFTQALGVNSLCAPARACLLTGKHSHINGKRSNHDAFDGKQQSFPRLLQAAGYETAIVGKWHLKVAPTGFDYYKVMRGHGNYFDSEFRETGRGWQREKGYLTNVITDSSIDWLKQRRSDKPFCLMVHHKAPHGPDIHEERHKRLFENETIAAPDTLHDDWETRDALRSGECAGTKLINCSWGQDIYRTLMASAPKEKRARTEVVYQQMIKGYMRLVASLDENVGRLLNHIDQAGLRDNTIVIYTSDNGFFLGDHGMYNKMWMYEKSMKLPLLIRYPGVVKPGTVNNDLVCMLDFAPSFLEIAGAKIPKDLQGRSIMCLLQGRPPAEWREGVYYHFYTGYGIPEHYGVRTKPHKLVHFPSFQDGNYWELFDLTEDADELTNVYTKPEYQEVAKTLHTLLTDYEKRLKVPGKS
jgi:arylsulfatase A-like enzyme